MSSLYTESQQTGKIILYGILTCYFVSHRLFVEGEESNVEDAKRYQKILKIHFSSYAIFVVSDYIPCLRFITKLQGIRGKFQQIADKIHKKMDEIIDINGHERRRIDANHKQDADRKKDFVDLLLETTSHDGKGTLDHETVRGVVMVNLIIKTLALMYRSQRTHITKQHNMSMCNSHM